MSEIEKYGDKKTKQATKEAPSAEAEHKKPRRLKIGSYKSFRLQRQVKSPHPKIVSGMTLFGRAVKILAQHWKLFGGILLIYAILNFIFVGAVGGNGNIGALKTALEETFTGHLAVLATGASLFTFLISSTGSTTSSLAGAYQTMLVILISLVIIWTLRQVYAANQVRIKDGFYQGTYPFVPFVLVLAVVGVQLIPAVFGGGLYATLVGGGIAITLLEKTLCGIVSFSLILLSLYMLCSSVFALYIVTLPDMTPLKALRSAVELVRYRRWIVLRKLIFLPFALVVILALIMIPVALYATPFATPLFFALSTMAVALVHSYMYALYRELL